MAGNTLYCGEALAAVDGSSGAECILASEECALIWEFRLLWIGEIQVISSHSSGPSVGGGNLSSDFSMSFLFCSSEITYILVSLFVCLNLYASEI